MPILTCFWPCTAISVSLCWKWVSLAAISFSIRKLLVDACNESGHLQRSDRSQQQQHQHHSHRHRHRQQQHQQHQQTLISRTHIRRQPPMTTHQIGQHTQHATKSNRSLWQPRYNRNEIRESRPRRPSSTQQRQLVYPESHALHCQISMHSTLCDDGCQPS